eukprot:CAMPEP_0117445420 /NCGR_PEP_ID=MMETSP0759-20121206/5785_1 /TAXON_ID=63605 /ORGANISM="Percolomonas cosmopolitus, Strain WS" /LENGTH=399 /DNA_ID=CAMNT_0005237593 /DNA_START=376 /DNA_END=1575 /DNA_ORIENTATION=+
MESLLDILDMYRKTETLKNEQKLQFVQDRMEKQHAELYFKQKIVLHLGKLLKDVRKCPLSAASSQSDTAHSSKNPLHIIIERVKNPRWRNILRDLWANADNLSATVPIVQRMETPRSVDSRVSSSTASSRTSSSNDSGTLAEHRRVFLTNDDELDLEQVKHQLNVQFLMQDTPECEQLLKKIQDAFRFEHHQLESDVEYIRQVLDDESDFNFKASHFILPSSQELAEIEQYLGDMLEHIHLQEKMDKMTSGKLSRMLTPHKQKLPPKDDLTPARGEENTPLSAPLKSHANDRAFKLLMNKENLLESSEDLQVVARVSRSKSSLGSANDSAPSSTSSSKYMQRVQNRIGATSGMKKKKELASFLSGESASEQASTEGTTKRRRPSTASRLRKTVLSNRMS